MGSMLTFENLMLNGSDQRRNSPSRQSFSSPSSLNSLRVSGRSRRRNDDSIRSYDYQQDPNMEPDSQVDGDIETVTEPLEMYKGGGGTRRRNTSLAPTNQQVIKLVPNQGYNESQNDCAPYNGPAISFPSILCIPCPCVSAPGSQNCPPTCVTYHPVDPSAAQTIPHSSNTQAVTPHMPQPTSLPIPASSIIPQTQVNHIYTYGNGGNAQFERDHHFPQNMPAACCGGQLQIQQRPPPPLPPPLPCYETQPSCPFNPNHSISSTSYFHESPQSNYGNGGCGNGGNQGCCPATSNDYRYFAPRRKRRCRREYYLQITKGKCRTGLPDDDSDSIERSITTGGPSRAAGGAGSSSRGTGGTMPGTRPTNFPINFRLQKAAMTEPITRPALPPTRPALTMGRPTMPTMRPALPATSFSSKSSHSSSSRNSSMNESVRSVSSVDTNKSATSPNSLQKTPDLGADVNSTPEEKSENSPVTKVILPVLKMPTVDGVDTKNVHTEKPEIVDKLTTNSRSNGVNGRSNGSASKTKDLGKPNGTIGKKLVFSTQAKKNKSSEERGRFGSVPLIQETAASVLRKRHNEIRMQAIREMLEKDMRRLKHA